MKNNDGEIHRVVKQDVVWNSLTVFLEFIAMAVVGHVDMANVLSRKTVVWVFLNREKEKKRKSFQC